MHGNTNGKPHMSVAFFYVTALKLKYCSVYQRHQRVPLLSDRFMQGREMKVVKFRNVKSHSNREVMVPTLFHFPTTTKSNENLYSLNRIKCLPFADMTSTFLPTKKVWFYDTILIPKYEFFLCYATP